MFKNSDKDKEVLADTIGNAIRHGGITRHQAERFLQNSALANPRPNDIGRERLCFLPKGLTGHELYATEHGHIVIVSQDSDTMTLHINNFEVARARSIWVRTDPSLIIGLCDGRETCVYQVRANGDLLQNFAVRCSSRPVGNYLLTDERLGHRKIVPVYGGGEAIADDADSSKIVKIFPRGEFYASSRRIHSVNGLGVWEYAGNVIDVAKLGKDIIAIVQDDLAEPSTRIVRAKVGESVQIGDNTVILTGECYDATGALDGWCHLRSGLLRSGKMVGYLRDFGGKYPELVVHAPGRPSYVIDNVLCADAFPYFVGLGFIGIVSVDQDLGYKQWIKDGFEPWDAVGGFSGPTASYQFVRGSARLVVVLQKRFCKMTEVFADEVDLQRIVCLERGDRRLRTFVPYRFGRRWRVNVGGGETVGKSYSRIFDLRLTPDRQGLIIYGCDGRAVWRETVEL